MKATRILVTRPFKPVCERNTRRFVWHGRRLSSKQNAELRSLVSNMSASSMPAVLKCSSATAPPSYGESEFIPGLFGSQSDEFEAFESRLEQAIYRCRFLAFMGVWGSLIGSFLCFIKGCTYVVNSFMEYFVRGGRGEKVVLTLVESIDVYLIGTVMLVFGMGLYELFISNINVAAPADQPTPHENSYSSIFFGLFKLQGRPQWLHIQTVNELKTKLGHVIVMVLLVGLLEKSKKVVICSTTDLLCFSATILLSSGSLYLLSRLNGGKTN